jgi:hypothetical protein
MTEIEGNSFRKQTPVDYRENNYASGQSDLETTDESGREDNPELDTRQKQWKKRDGYPNQRRDFRQNNDKQRTQDKPEGNLAEQMAKMMPMMAAMAGMPRGRDRKENWPNDDRFRDKAPNYNYANNFNTKQQSHWIPNQGYRGRGGNQGRYDGRQGYSQTTYDGRQNYSQPTYDGRQRFNPSTNDGKCFYCGIAGHYKQDCRKFQRDQGTRNQTQQQPPRRAIEGPKPPPRQNQNCQCH